MTTQQPDSARADACPKCGTLGTLLMTRDWNGPPDVFVKWQKTYFCDDCEQGWDVPPDPPIPAPTGATDASEPGEPAEVWLARRYACVASGHHYEAGEHDCGKWPYAGADIDVASAPGATEPLKLTDVGQVIKWVSAIGYPPYIVTRPPTNPKPILVLLGQSVEADGETLEAALHAAVQALAEGGG